MVDAMQDGVTNCGYVVASIVSPACGREDLIAWARSSLASLGDQETLLDPHPPRSLPMELPKSIIRRHGTPPAPSALAPTDDSPPTLSARQGSGIGSPLRPKNVTMERIRVKPIPDTLSGSVDKKASSNLLSPNKQPDDMWDMDYVSNKLKSSLLGNDEDNEKDEESEAGSWNFDRHDKRVEEKDSDDEDRASGEPEEDVAVATDYKRGKRLKRLSLILRGQRTTKALWDFTWRMYLCLLILFAVHVVVFAIMTSLLSEIQVSRIMNGLDILLTTCFCHFRPQSQIFSSRVLPQGRFMR